MVNIGKKPSVKSQINSGLENSLVLVALVFLFPVGLYLMYRKTSWPKKFKHIITVLGLVFWSIIVIALVYAPPLVTMTNLDESMKISTEEAEYKLEGTISPPDAALTINDEEVEVDKSGDFVHTIELKEKDNEIVVVATKSEDRVTTQKYIIYRYTSEEIADRKAERERAAEEAASAKAAEEVEKEASAERRAEEQEEPKSEMEEQEEPKSEMEERAESIAFEALGTVFVDDLNDNKNSCYAFYTLDSSQYWDDKAIASGATNTFVESAKLVFEDSRCDYFSLHFDATGTDGRGNDIEFRFAGFSVDRQVFKQYNWERIKGSSVGEQLVRDDILRLPLNSSTEPEAFSYN